MASVNIDKNRIEKNVRREFPQLTKPTNIVEVVAVAVELDATSPDKVRTGAELVAKGVKPHAIGVAVRLGVLERTKVSKFRFLIVERGSRPKTAIETAQALQLERKGLYDHLLHDTKAAKVAADALKLPPGSSVVSIQRAMEKGTVQHQIDLYDRVFSALETHKLYDPQYDYLRLCFRRKAAKYWLSKLGKKLAQ